NRGPEQERPLVPAPNRGELVERRELRVRMQRDETDAEVVREERVRQRRVRDGAEHELSGSGRPRKGHELAVARRCADERKHRLSEAQAEREDQREVTELRNHCPLAARPFSSASATAGGR